MSRHAAAPVDDSTEILTGQPEIAATAMSLRAIAAQRFAVAADVVEHLQLNGAADLLVTLVAQRDDARDLAARLEAENARLEAGHAAEQ